MSCIVPGHVIVLPSKDHLDNAAGLLSEYTNQKIEIVYSVRDILNHYHLAEEAQSFEEKVGPFPFIAQVPDGDELKLSSDFAKIPGISSSIPDFFIRPSGFAPELNSSAFDDALALINCRENAPINGEGLKIAILDTGIEKDFLQTPAALHPIQFDTGNRRYGSEATEAEDVVGHGTLVAYIINKIAPAAELLSLRVMGHTGTMGSFLAGVYLAEAKFKPDIFNLSLSINCDIELCGVCRTPRNATISGDQIRHLFENIINGRGRGKQPPIFIAAAGNNRNTISIPASLPRFIAVGSYDLHTDREAKYSSYESVPVERYILAPGGSSDPNGALGFRNSGTYERNPTLYGTSFSAAFVSGVIARYLCMNRYLSDSLRLGAAIPTSDDYQVALEYLRQSSDSSWPDYNPNKHGIGLLKWNQRIAERRERHHGGANPCTREQIYLIVDTTGSMEGKLKAVADHISAIDTLPAQSPVFRLVLYGDHEDDYVVYLQRVSESIQDIVEAIRTAPMTEGGDEPEALEDALHFVNNEIDQMGLSKIRVAIFTDAPPHPPEECPCGYDFNKEAQKLSAIGAVIEIIGCNQHPNDFGEGYYENLNTYTLSDHRWN